MTQDKTTDTGTTNPSNNACGVLENPIVTIFWRAACIGLLILVFLEVNATKHDLNELRTVVDDEMQQMNATTARLSYTVGLPK